MRTWYDFGISTGLDHRCVHCIIRYRGGFCRPVLPSHSLCGWTPNLNTDGEPADFQDQVERSLQSIDNVDFAGIEQILLDAAIAHGSCQKPFPKFVPSRVLQALSHRRRTAHDPAIRRQLTFQVRKRHRLEIRHWKASKLNVHLQRPSRWNMLRQLPRKSEAQNFALQPPLDGFAKHLEKLFSGSSHSPEEPLLKSEPDWSLLELLKAIGRLKCAKASDECGLVGDLFHHVPTALVRHLQRLYNDVLRTGECPLTWRKTLFTMIAKKKQAMLVSDFRAIARIRLLYKIFSYMILARIEPVLEEAQPEEQHGFRPGRRLEEQLP